MGFTQVNAADTGVDRSFEAYALRIGSEDPAGGMLVPTAEGADSANGIADEIEADTLSIHVDERVAADERTAEELEREADRLRRNGTPGDHFRACLLSVRAGRIGRGVWIYPRGSGGSDSLPLGGKRVEVAYKHSYALSPEASGIMSGTRMQQTAFLELEDSGADYFGGALSAAKQGNPHGASAYAYSEEEYKEMRMFVSADGTSGFAIKEDGDIVSVFKGPGGPGWFAHSAMLLAVQEGGRKADAFDTVLPHIYSLHGFVARSRIPWNEGYAPNDWDKGTFAHFNGGEPDVVYLALDKFSSAKYLPGSGMPTDDVKAAEAERDRYVNP